MKENRDLHIAKMPGWKRNKTYQGLPYPKPKADDHYFMVLAFLGCCAMSIYSHYHFGDIWACWCLLCAGACVVVGWWNE